MSSIAATVGLPRRALYSASKGAVHALTLAMAADLVTEGVRVNCVAPARWTRPGSPGCSPARTTRRRRSGSWRPASPRGVW
ncbi:SDR family NAD(P)-dependent oxidoreductase [Micromonospora sp. M12]